MKIKQFTAALLIFATVFSLCSCKVKTTPTINGSTVSQTEETAQNGENNTSPSPTSAAGDEETTADNFKYKSEDALYLGKLESEIYGNIYLYYQDNHIVGIDDYASVGFTLNAQNFAPPEENEDEDEDEKVLQTEDMNFDGYTDFRLKYRSTSLNSYYLCWIWDMELKKFAYYEPLSSIPSPSFDSTNENVLSTNKTSQSTATLTTYTWQDDELYPIKHQTIQSDEDIITGPEDANTTIAICDGLQLSSVELTGNKNSKSKWLCKIENESIVRLYDDTVDEATASYKFTFRGIAKGTTTVVFRYATSWNNDYIAEKVVNITVDENRVLYIVSTK